jgi:ferric-dicitrate binding protein FerR (iron transport regulator)
MDRQDPANPGDDDIARLLRAAGPREQLPADMQQRWEQQFRAELKPVLEGRGRSRRNWIMGLCAGLAAVAGAITLLQGPSPAVGPQVLVSLSHGQSQLLVPDAAARDVVVGQQLEIGSTVNTGADAMVALKYGQYDLRINRDTRLLIDEEQLVLERGEVYASDYGFAGTDRQLSIRTAHGTIRDIGTQFTVIASTDSTVTTVRRGAVIIDTGRQELRAEPERGFARRLIIDGKLNVTQEQVAAGGADWDWIYLGGTDFTLEGSSAYDFLQWSVGESGQQLEFASPGAETLARSTRLHGDISGLNPEQAVQPVLASTDLTAEHLADNTLRISINR